MIIVRFGCSVCVDVMNLVLLLLGSWWLSSSSWCIGLCNVSVVLVRLLIMLVIMFCCFRFDCRVWDRLGLFLIRRMCIRNLFIGNVVDYSVWGYGFVFMYVSGCRCNVLIMLFF